MSDDTMIELTSSAASPQLLLHAPGQEMVLTIFNNGEELVTIDKHGTVTIHKEGAAPEAAKVFWDCITYCYQTAIHDRERLKLEVEELKHDIERAYTINTEYLAEVEELRATLADIQSAAEDLDLLN